MCTLGGTQPRSPLIASEPLNTCVKHASSGLGSYIYSTGNQNRNSWIDHFTCTAISVPALDPGNNRVKCYDSDFTLQCQSLNRDGTSNYQTNAIQYNSFKVCITNIPLFS